MNCCNSPFSNKPFGGINADVLRAIAVVCMVADHVWACGVPLGNWMNYIGRVAFPVFAFQLAEGFLHTSNFKKYFFRLLIGAVFSEIPFNYLSIGKFLNPDYQNVLFTFLFGLLAMFFLDKIKKDPTPLKVSGFGLLVIGCVVAAELLKTDYGYAGVLTVLLFYILRDFPFAWLAQAAAMVIINVFAFPGRPVAFRIFGEFVILHVQFFALLSLIPIWLYNGRKSRFGKKVQYAFYGFYPVHLAVLDVVRYFMTTSV